MHNFLFLLIVFVTFCSIKITFAGVYGIDCECICCGAPIIGNCTQVDVGYVHIMNATICDLNQCLTQCKLLYPVCELENGKMETTCTDS